jgi:acyl carrier protein
MDTRIEDELKKLVCERMTLPLEPAAIADDQPLFVGPPGSLDLDSIEALELVVGIEERFGVHIPAVEGISDRFFSVATLAELVRGLQRGAV